MAGGLVEVNHRERNKAFTDAAVESAGGECAEKHRADAARRIAEGAAEYGEEGYTNRDCAREAAEEFIDAANWLGFEFIKIADDAPRDETRLLCEAASAAVNAHDIVQRYLKLRDG